MYPLKNNDNIYYITFVYISQNNLKKKKFHVIIYKPKKRRKTMIEVIEETLIDGIKLLPFLFITYLIMEYIEHKTNKKAKETIKKSGKFGPLIGRNTWNIPTMWIFCISN